MNKGIKMPPEEIFFWSKCMHLPVKDIVDMSRNQGRYILKQNKERKNGKR
jgi:hypothetical protein